MAMDNEFEQVSEVHLERIKRGWGRLAGREVTPVCVRIPADDYRDLKAMARADRKTIGELFGRLIVRERERRDRKNAEISH